MDDTQTENRVKLEEYLAKIPASKKTSFACPKCGKQSGTPKPPRFGKHYSSMTVCPDCDSMFFKWVYSDGRVELGEVL